MDVLCVEQFSTLGGGQRSLLDLLPAFSARGLKPTVLVPNDGPLPAAVRDLGFPTEYLHCGAYSSIHKPLGQLLRYARELPPLATTIDKVVRERGFGALYVNGPRFLPPAAWAAARHRIPIVFHCHSRLLQPSAIALAGLSLRLSRARVIACCKYAAQPLTPYVRARDISIVYNGVAAPRGAPLKISARVRHIGVLGRIEPEKGQIEFVRAVRTVLKQFPDCSFCIAGAPMFSTSSYYEEVIREARGLPVQFLEWQSDVGAVLSNLDLLVVPSTPFEATTRVILEAYATGLPVVAFPSGGIPEVVIMA